MDDAGVYRLGDDLALVQSVDFFTPIVDDARDWGRISAANAVSDIYAMGGRPLTALSIVGWPRDVLPFELLTEVLDGAAATLSAAGCTLVGGHSIDDPEPKFGLAVTGIVDPSRVVRHRGARGGDVLVLTKPIGTGLVSTAIKRDRAEPAWRQAATESMAALNDAAAGAMVAAGAHAATDVTGFGLLGHLGEMLQPDDLAAQVYLDRVPLLPGARELAGAGIVPGGTERNLAAVGRFTDFGDAGDPDRLVLADAQTSGGLLIAIDDDAAGALIASLDLAGVASTIVGRVTGDTGFGVEVVAGP